MQRVRRNARDDIQRELVKTRLASEHETADWMNNFLDRFWPIYEPVLSATVISSVDQILSTNTPAFLDSLRLSEFTLGNKAPRIDKVRTFPNTEDDIVMMDWGVSFTPNDTSDMTEKQKTAKVNPKIVLSIRVGKSLATAVLPVLVEDVSFSGLLRIRMKLMANFPHVQVVDICFLEKPVIDYVLKPIGGDTFGFDIANVGLSFQASTRLLAGLTFHIDAGSCHLCSRYDTCNSWTDDVRPQHLQLEFGTNAFW
jgi:Ca2+-dependent lipid-binding protein